MIMLTQEERDKFVAYLEQQAKSDMQMADQLARMNGHDAAIKRYRTESMAQQIVAKMLKGIVDFVVESGKVI